jgi:methionyl aminopeptidase
MTKIRLKSEEDIAMLRISGGILARTLKSLAADAREGVTLAALDKKARAYIAAAGAVPTFLGYVPEGMEQPYPAAICASVNDTVVHGLPGNYALKEGDVLSIDLGVTYKGYVTDGATTVGIGSISKEAKALIAATKEALEKAIKACAPHGRMGDIGEAVEKTAKKAHFRVLQGLTGHGVGFELHEDPTVYNYGKQGEGMELVPGLVIAIEPMFSAGSPYGVHDPKDDSFATKDGSLSAHFEHTVAILEKGIEVLTK